MELIQDNSAAAKRREKCDFSVSSIIGLKEAPKRASTDERDSVGKHEKLIHSSLSQVDCLRELPGMECKSQLMDGVQKVRT